MASTATLSPCTTLNTPSGSPASAHSEASSSDADGSFSDGLSTNVLPHAMASGNIHIGTMAGKLNGVMPATTPTGCLIEYESTPVETFSEYPPLSRCGMPQANSTTSRPRATSPAASEATLPCSSVMSSASSAGAGADQLAEREQDRGALGQGDAAPGRERPGRATARSTSAGSAKSTWPVTCPVAGSYTSPWRSDSPSQGLPPIQPAAAPRSHRRRSPRERGTALPTSSACGRSSFTTAPTARSTASSKARTRRRSASHHAALGRPLRRRAPGEQPSVY